MTDFPKRAAAFAKFCNFLIDEVDLEAGLRIASAADEVIRIAVAEAFDIANNLVKEALAEIKVEK